MGQKMDQMKLLNQLRKAQKELKNEIVEVEAGDGAVIVQINGELKVKKIKIDPAVASGPMITTLNDILSACIYYVLVGLCFGCF